MTDTHAHVYLKDFDNDLHEVVLSAKKSGIDCVLMPNIDQNSISKMIHVQSQFPTFCRPMVGLHPCYVKKNYQDQLTDIEKWFDKHDFIGIGEVGLDLFHATDLLKEQIDAFEIQISWAKAKKLPLAIHTRNSFEETIKILKKNQNGDIKGVFHCFSGSLQEANEILDLGFLLGIGGLLTFKNSKLPNVIKQLPINSIVLETDSPYLAPTPFRGKRNEPQYIINTAQALASIVNFDIQKLYDILESNVKTVFPKRENQNYFPNSPASLKT